MNNLTLNTYRDTHLAWPVLSSTMTIIAPTSTSFEAAQLWFSSESLTFGDYGRAMANRGVPGSAATERVSATPPAEQPSMNRLG